MSTHVQTASTQAGKKARPMVRHRPRDCRRKNDAMRLHSAGLLSDLALTQLFAACPHWRNA